MGERLKLPSWVLGGQDSWAPTPAPHPILLQPGPCRAPPFPNPGRLPPAGLACTCAWRAPPPPPRPGAPSGVSPSPRLSGRWATAVEVGGGNARAGSAWVLGTLRGREFVSAAQKPPPSSALGCQEAEITLPHRQHFWASFCGSFSSPSPLWNPTPLRSLLGGSSGKWERRRASPLHPTEWRTMGGRCGWGESQAVVSGPEGWAGQGRAWIRQLTQARPGLSSRGRTVRAEFIFKTERITWKQGGLWGQSFPSPNFLSGQCEKGVSERLLPWRERGERKSQVREKS